MELKKGLGGVAVVALLGAGVMLASADEPGSIATDGPRLVISDFVGTVIVEEGRSFDYSLDMKKGLVSEPQISQSNGNLIISGDDDVQIRNCNSNWNGNKMTMQLKGDRRKHDLADFPVLRVTAPANANLELELDGGEAKVTDLASYSLATNGCGDVELGDTSGPAEISLNGSGDVILGESATLKLSINGSGDVEAGDVRGEGVISLRGSGDAEIDSIGDELTADLRGSGDIVIGEVTGSTTVSLRGSGDVTIADGNVSDLKIDLRGSGDISVRGQANDVSVLLYGSGDVYVARATGNRDVNRYGSGDVRIGDQRYDD